MKNIEKGWLDTFFIFKEEIVELIIKWIFD